jgi:serine/threonine protein kinase
MGEFLYEFVDHAGRLEHRIVCAMTLEDAYHALDTEGISYKWLVLRDSSSDRAALARIARASTRGRSSMGEFLYEFVDRAGRGRLEHRVVRAMTLEHARHALDTEGISYNWLVAREAGVRSLELDRVYVADFGLALKTEDVQLTSQVAGTLPYMSPEQTTGDVSHLDGRSDIFSLGVVFYELLVGERPFHGKSPADLFREIRSGTPKSPDRWPWGVPETLSAICMKCLAKPPTDRFQTGKELADELHRWLTPKDA